MEFFKKVHGVLTKTPWRFNKKSMEFSLRNPFSHPYNPYPRPKEMPSPAQFPAHLPRRNCRDILLKQGFRGTFAALITPSSRLGHRTKKHDRGTFAAVRDELNLEEDVLAIEEIQEQPGDGEVAKVPEKIAPGFAKEGFRPAKEEVGDVLKADVGLGEVDGDGVHTNNAEWEGPAFEAEDVDDVIEEGEKRRGEARCEEREGGAPEGFDTGHQESESVASGEEKCRGEGESE